MDEQEAIQTLEASKRRSSPPSPDNQLQQQSTPVLSRPNAAARHSKRLTLNFPINIPPNLTSQSQFEVASPAGTVMPPSSQASAIQSPNRSSAATPTFSEHADEAYEFFTALAAQERRVLELREELQKAETELVNLKRQWAMAESGKGKSVFVKPTEGVTSPRVSARVQSPEGSNNDGDRGGPPEMTKLALQTRLSRDMENRNSLRQSPVQSPAGIGPGALRRSKTVFQGSRHTRTLSLLSPTGVDTVLPFPQSGEEKTIRNMRTARYPRSATLPSIERDSKSTTGTSASTARSHVSEDTSLWRRSLPPVAADGTTDGLMRTGKQMASDFKDGLWTFIEDIRQATVGEEGINATETRPMNGGVRAARDKTTGSNKKTSTSSKRRSKLSESVSTQQDMSFWSEFGLDAPDPAAKTNPAVSTNKNEQKDTEKSSLLDVDDNWDVWDTPVPKTHTPSSSGSTFPSSKREQSPSTGASSPRTSTSIADFNPMQDECTPKPSQSDTITWPDLKKLRPSSITKTASNFLAEWERSLSSSPLASPAHETEVTFGKEQKND